MKSTRFRPLLLLAFGLAGTAAAEAPPRFPDAAVWHRDIRAAAVHPQSASMISTWNGLGGFGNGRMQIDIGFKIVHAPANAPMRTLVGYPDAGEYYAPDCEPLGTPMPVPADAEIEWQDGLDCADDSDCHLLVVQGNRLYEAYRARAIGATQLGAQCLAVWKLDTVYPDDNRGDHCTSADAAGFPIAPLLFNADEVYDAMQVADGDLGHAIRFILPNPRMASTTIDGDRYGLYVRPASHAGGPSGPEAAIPYGSRLRLKADFPVHLYPAGAQVILRTMQRYGIVLSDGGNIALTAETDRYTDHSWDDVGITPQTFYQAVPSEPVQPVDFDVLDTGPRIVETWECVRNVEDPAPTGLTARLTIATWLRYDGVRLEWSGGAARVDIYRNATYLGTLANIGKWTGKYDGNRLSAYRVCNEDTTVCTEAVIPVPDGWTLPQPTPTPTPTPIPTPPPTKPQQSARSAAPPPAATSQSAAPTRRDDHR